MNKKIFFLVFALISLLLTACSKEPSNTSSMKKNDISAIKKYELLNKEVVFTEFKKQGLEIILSDDLNISVGDYAKGGKIYKGYLNKDKSKQVTIVIHKSEEEALNTKRKFLESAKTVSLLVFPEIYVAKNVYIEYYDLNNKDSKSPIEKVVAELKKQTK